MTIIQELETMYQKRVDKKELSKIAIAIVNKLNPDMVKWDTEMYRQKEIILSCLDSL